MDADGKCSARFLDQQFLNMYEFRMYSVDVVTQSYHQQSLHPKWPCILTHEQGSERFSQYLRETACSYRREEVGGECLLENTPAVM